MEKHFHVDDFGNNYITKNCNKKLNEDENCSGREHHLHYGKKYYINDDPILSAKLQTRKFNITDRFIEHDNFEGKEHHDHYGVKYELSEDPIDDSSEELISDDNAMNNFINKSRFVHNDEIIDDEINEIKSIQINDLHIDTSHDNNTYPTFLVESKILAVKVKKIKKTSLTLEKNKRSNIFQTNDNVNNDIDTGKGSERKKRSAPVLEKNDNLNIINDTDMCTLTIWIRLLWIRS